MRKFYTYHFCCLLESLAKGFKIEWDYFIKSIILSGVMTIAVSV